MTWLQRQQPNSPSCPALCRASTSYFAAQQGVDGRDKPGHDGQVRTLSIRQRKYPKHRAAVRVLEFWRQRRKRARMARPVAYRHCHVLLAVDAVGDRERVDRIVEL